MAVVTEINEDKENVNEWVRYGLKLAVQSVLHPFEYSKVLIQVSNVA
jgi:carrier protein